MNDHLEQKATQSDDYNENSTRPKVPRKVLETLRAERLSRAQQIEQMVCQPLEKLGKELHTRASSKEIALIGNQAINIAGDETQLHEDVKEIDWDREISRYYSTHPLENSTDFPNEEDPRFDHAAAQLAELLSSRLRIAYAQKHISGRGIASREGDDSLSREGKLRILSFPLPENLTSPILTARDRQAATKINMNLTESSRVDVIKKLLELVGSDVKNQRQNAPLPILPEEYDARVLGTLLVSHDKTEIVSVLAPTKAPGLFIDYTFKKTPDEHPQGPAIQMGFVVVPPFI